MSQIVKQCRAKGYGTLLIVPQSILRRLLRIVALKKVADAARDLINAQTMAKTRMLGAMKGH